MTSIPPSLLDTVVGGFGPRLVLLGALYTGTAAGLGWLLKTEWDVEHGGGPGWWREAHDARLRELSAQAAARQAR